jgi:hypothetical protein
MALDGTYGFLYSGAISLGFGVFNIKGGKVVGSDYAGGRYHGTATEGANGKIAVDITFEVAPGLPLVQGTSPQELPYSRRIQETFPPGFGDGAPLTFESPPGNITTMIKRIPDGFEPAALYGFTLKANEPAAA